MIATTLLLTALLPQAGGAAPAPPTALVEVAQDRFAALLQEHDAAVEAWQKALDETEDRNARLELRKNNPSRAFYPRFEELANEGEGRATFWLVENANNSGLRASERDEAVLGHYRTLFAKHVAADWFGAVIERFARERKVEDGVKLELLRGAMEQAKADGTKALAMFAVGSILVDGEGTTAEGEEVLRKVAETYPKTAVGTLARARFITDADLVVGKPAPDFFGQTIDGFGFNLSDYRGKVVLVDFYGFW
jgi:hypothetical protein